MFGNHGLCGLLEEGAHEKSPKCLDGTLGDFGGILQRSQVISFVGGFLPFEQRQSFGIDVHHFAGIGLVVAFGLPFEFFLNTAFYLGQTFHSVLCLFKTVVGAGLGFEQLGPCGLKCTIDGDAADLVAVCQGGDAFFSLRVGQPNGLAVVRVFLCMFMFQYSPGNTVNNATGSYK